MQHAYEPINPWRCQYIDEPTEKSRPLLGLRPLNLRPGHVAPINELLKPCPRDEFYVVNKPREAYWRVLFDNAGPGDRSASIVGESGHLERANAWIHLIGAVVFAMYAVIRAFAIDQHSYTAQLSGVSCIAVSIMFAVSTVYHVFNSVPGCAAIVRNLDIIAIYISMAVGYMADSALLTNDFSNVPFQTLADPMLAAVSLVFFFSVRRYFVPKDETRDFQFEESCSLGLFRFFHSDLEHAGLRVAGITTLTFSWMLYVSAAFNNVNQGVGAIWLTGVIFATIMLISGVVFDNMLVPDNAYADGKHAWWRCTACNSKTLGCAMTSHAWWHVISFCSVVIMTAAREYGLVYLRWSP